jgi:hypothetical protein
MPGYIQPPYSTFAPQPTPAATLPGGVTLPETSPGQLPPVKQGFEAIQEEAAGKVPFGFISQVSDALDVAAAPGPALDFSFSVFGSNITVDPYAISAPVAGFRPVLLGLMLLGLAWAVGRRVFASVGGTPGDEG